jgi:hypothetical protein
MFGYYNYPPSLGLFSDGGFRVGYGIGFPNDISSLGARMFYNFSDPTDTGDANFIAENAAFDYTGVRDNNNLFGPNPFMYGFFGCNGSLA